MLVLSSLKISNEDSGFFLCYLSLQIVGGVSTVVIVLFLVGSMPVISSLKISNEDSGLFLCYSQIVGKVSMRIRVFL